MMLVRKEIAREIPCCLSNERGTALIITLLIIVSLVGLTFAFSEDSAVELSLAGYSAQGYRAYEMAVSGFNMAVALLTKDEDLMSDTLLEDWAKFNGDGLPDDLKQDGSLQGLVVDENSKFNINKLRKPSGEIDELQAERFKRLLEILGLGEELLNPLLDWLDEDDIKRLNGAENYYYQSLSEPYDCGNGPLLTIRQLFMIKGYRDLSLEDKKRLLKYLTIYSDGKININTASSEVIQCLSPEIDSSIANSIIEYRKEKGFSSIQDLGAVPGVEYQIFHRLRPILTVKASSFLVNMKANFQDGSSEIVAVVKRENAETKLLYWRVI